ncbi:MAG: hypothetical protein AB7R90_19535 [Reyranellaceae bacterium]
MTRSMLAAACACRSITIFCAALASASRAFSASSASMRAPRPCHSRDITTSAAPSAPATIKVALPPETKPTAARIHSMPRAAPYPASSSAHHRQIAGT